VSLLLLALDLYSLIVFIAVILSWVRLSPDNPVVRVIDKLTEPVLDKIRRVLPAFGGMDFSPMVLLFALRMLRRVLVADL
jgi:YggT family protein